MDYRSQESLMDNKLMLMDC